MSAYNDDGGDGENNRGIVDQIVVADGGSQDGTVACARAAGAIVIEESPAQWQFFVKTFMHLKLASCIYETSPNEDEVPHSLLDAVIFFDCRQCGHEQDMQILINGLEAGEEFLIGRRSSWSRQFCVLPPHRVSNMKVWQRLWLWQWVIPRYFIGDCMVIRYDIFNSVINQKWTPWQQCKAWFKGFHLERF